MCFMKILFEIVMADYQISPKCKVAVLSELIYSGFCFAHTYAAHYQNKPIKICLYTLS